MATVIELRREAREIEDFLKSPFEDDRTPAQLIRDALREVYSDLKHAMPSEKSMPDVASLDILEIARLAGLTPEEIRRFAETARPVDGAEEVAVPSRSDERAYFCDKLDDDGRVLGLLVAAPRGGRWRIFDLPLSMRREARDSAHAGDQMWEAFMRGIDEYLIGVMPDEWDARAALREFSKPSDPSYESLVAAAAVNFRLCRRSFANAVALFSMASLARGYATGDTITVFTKIESEGGLHARLSGRTSGGTPERNRSAGANLDRPQ